MLGLECNICCNLFDRNEHLPRIVNCGHTFCSECLTEILQSSSSCPACKKIITNDTGTSCDSFTVNYFVLEVKDSEKQMLPSREDFVDKSLKKLLKLRTDYSKLTTAIIIGKERLALNLAMITDAEKSLDEMIEDHNPFNQDYLEEVKKLKQNYENIRREIIPFEALRFGDASMLSGSYDSTSRYLSEIYRGILEGKRFATVTKINDVPNFAKLSVRDNFLFLHSFEKVKMEEDIVTVCFHDFVDKLLKKKVDIEDASTSDASKDPKISADLLGFLDLTYGSEGYYRRVFIDILSSASHLGSQFLKYCSGEEGYSYKGSKYEQQLGDAGDNFPGLKYDGLKVDRLIQLQNWNKNDVASNRLSVSRYLQKKNNTMVDCDFDTHYLRFEDDGSFEILKFHLTKRTSDANAASPFCPNEKPTFGPLSSFLNPTSLPKFDFASSSVKLDSTSTLGAQNAGTKSDSKPTFSLPNSSAESDSRTTFGLPNSSTESDSRPTLGLLYSSVKSDTGLFSGLEMLNKKTIFDHKKNDRKLRSTREVQNSVPTTDSNSRKLVYKSPSLKPDSGYESQISFPSNSACIKSPPRISKIVGSILDHEMNILETFANAKVRTILDCGIAFKL